MSKRYIWHFLCNPSENVFKIMKVETTIPHTFYGSDEWNALPYITWIEIFHEHSDMMWRFTIPETLFPTEILAKNAMKRLIKCGIKNSESKINELKYKIRDSESKLNNENVLLTNLKNALQECCDETN